MKPLRSGLILAGGMSMRMGRDKGLIEIGGRPLVVWVIGRLSEVVDEIAVATSPTNDAAYRAVVPGSVRCVSDETPHLGPLGGWRWGLPTLHGEYVAIAPCDSPLYAPELGRMLFDRAAGHDGAVPKLGDRYEPLHGVYHRQRLERAVLRTLGAGQSRPIHTYAHLDIVDVGETEVRRIDPDLESFMNANTPDELERLRSRLSAGPQM